MRKRLTLVECSEALARLNNILEWSAFQSTSHNKNHHKTWRTRVNKVKEFVFLLRDLIDDAKSIESYFVDGDVLLNRFNEILKRRGLPNPPVLCQYNHAESNGVVSSCQLIIHRLLRSKVPSVPFSE